MKHTNGPWVAEKAKLDQGHIEIYAKSILVADVMSDDNSADGNGFLNARLIAAAPEMLEALKYAAEIVKTARQYFPASVKNSDKFHLENTCATINKAIAKAEGQNV